mgnify:CR=1 FL=1
MVQQGERWLRTECRSCQLYHHHYCRLCSPILKSLVVSFFFSFFFSLPLLLFLLLLFFFFSTFPSLLFQCPFSRVVGITRPILCTLCVFIRLSRSAKTLTVAAAVSFIVPAFGNVATRRRTSPNPRRGAEGERGGREEDARLDISVNTSRWNKRLEYRLVRVSLEKALERSRSSIVRRASSSPVLFPRYYRSAPLYRTYSRHLRLRGFFFATHVERRNIATSRATSICRFAITTSARLTVLVQSRD